MQQWIIGLMRSSFNNPVIQQSITPLSKLLKYQYIEFASVTRFVNEIRLNYHPNSNTDQCNKGKGSQDFP